VTGLCRSLNADATLPHYAWHMPTLYLIDGYAQFFRAYHAIRTPMTSPVTKEPTNMSFGFVGMLLKLLRGEGEHLSGDGSPTHIAVALDVSGDRGTFRSELYPEYKANRDAPPDDLKPQVERMLAMLEAIGVPCVGSEGFEADDVIATLVDQYAGDDVRIRFISKDKDLKQLLADGRVEMFDVHTDVLITADTLKDETDLTPAQVVDMLTLMGDTADNVPGVPGIGPKTAAQLIAEFGDLDAVLAEVLEDKPRKDWKIKGKRRENLAAAARTLPLSKELITLRADVPVEFDLERSAVDSFDLRALGPILKELGFNRYQDELKVLIGGDGGPAGESTRAAAPSFGGGLFDQEPDERDVEGDYTCVRTREQLDELVGRLETAPAIALDTETTSPRPMKAELVGLSFSPEPGRAWYVPVRSPDPDAHLDAGTVLDALRPIIEDPVKPKLGHNLKYDLLVLRRHGVTLRGFTTPDAGAADSGDSMIASYLIDASRSSHSMDALALALLGRSNIPIKELIGTGKSQKTFDQVPLDRAAPYAAEDADVTLQLCALEHPRIEEMGLGELYRNVEIPLVEVLAELEFNGILVDPDELDRQRGRLEARITELTAQIHDAAMEAIGVTFDIDSPKQLSTALFGKPTDEPPGLGLKPIKKTKTGYSTDAEVLQKLTDDPLVDSPIPALVLDYRQLTKLVNTYLVSLKDEIHPETKRIHASFNQTVAATGRLSSSDPNLQNIPIRTDVGREIRRAFVAPEGRVLISADYSQIELRILAHLSEDPALCAAFERGEDIHTAVAAQVHGVPLDEVTKEQRSGAKMVNFGIVYGITAFGLARRLGCSNTEADEIITGYKKRFAGITTFLEECVEQARRHGYVETMLKRRRPINDIDSNQPNRRNLAERMAINSVVQGSAADLIKLAMIDVHRRIKAGGTPELADVLMLLQIHDELVFEAPKASADDAAAVIVDRMQQAMTLRVPLVVDHGVSENWYAGK
jgi:DNA polymerase-1